MENNGIILISAEQIYQHPDNPRKDLGDLQELSDSIKKKGIMQNLTVIPGHHITDEEWKKMAEEYKKNPSEELRTKMNTINSRQFIDGGYTLIIGHRRFAAGKMAGVTEFPCRVVSDMSQKEQVSTMLEENMQRNDLTIWEQANGFQMMLDLGDTEEQIAEKTGFSKTTIKHRLNIAKLDQKTLKQKESQDGFQMTLTDLYELEKIKDVKARNKVLKDATDSRDLARRAINAVNEQKREENKKAYIAVFKKLGIEKAPKEAADEYYSNKWEKTQEIQLDREQGKEIKAPKDGEKLFYMERYSWIYIIKKAKKEKKQLSPAEMEKKKHDSDKKKLKEIYKEASNTRRAFIEGIINGSIEPIKDTKELEDELFEQLIAWEAYLSRGKLKKFFLGKDSYMASEEENNEAEKKIESLSHLHKLMCFTSVCMEETELMDYNYKYNSKKGEKVMRFYAILEKYSFSFSNDSEKAVMDGTSDLYVKEAVNGK